VLQHGLQEEFVELERRRELLEQLPRAFQKLMKDRRSAKNALGGTVLVQHSSYSQAVRARVLCRAVGERTAGPSPSCRGGHSDPGTCGRS